MNTLCTILLAPSLSLSLSPFHTLSTMQSSIRTNAVACKAQRTVAAAAAPPRAQMTTKKVMSVVGGAVLALTLQQACVHPAEASQFEDKFAAQEAKVKSQAAKLQAIVARQEAMAANAAKRAANAVVRAHSAAMEATPHAASA